MTTMQLRKPLKKGWFVAGAALLVALGISIGLRGFVNDATPYEYMRWWRYATGTVLLGVFMYQWTLFLSRRTGNVWLASKRYRLHKWLGIGFLALFVLHAGTIGHGIMGFVAAGLVIIVLTGLFSAEVLLLSGEKWRRARLFIHYAVAAAIVPLITVHIWTALAYK